MTCFSSIPRLQVSPGPRTTTRTNSDSKVAGLVNYNYLSKERLASFGLSLDSAADRAILNAPINSAAASRFQNRLPFPGFLPTATIAQSLRPFPQFNSGL